MPPKPVVYGTGQPVIAPLPSMPAPAEKSKDGGGWDKAIGQVASAAPKLIRKSKKPWPTKGMIDSIGSAGKA